MKYDKMVCWVRPREKKEIEEAVNGHFPVEFAKSYDDFKAKITADSCLVFSIVKAVKELKKCKDLVREFPTHKFLLYYRSNNDGFMTDNEMTLFEEKNVVMTQFMASGLVRFYLEHDGMNDDTVGRDN